MTIHLPSLPVPLRWFGLGASEQRTKPVSSPFRFSVLISASSLQLESDEQPLELNKEESERFVASLRSSDPPPKELAEGMAHLRKWLKS
jgi:hypothetical protein